MQMSHELSEREAAVRSGADVGVVAENLEELLVIPPGINTSHILHVVVGDKSFNPPVYVTKLPKLLVHRLQTAFR